MNLVCCICTEILTASADVYSTPCGHLFHHHCLQKWLERSKSCPQCRFSFAARNILKVYFNIGNLETSFSDLGVLQQTNDDLKLQLNQKAKEISDLQATAVREAQLKLKLNDKYHVAQEKIRSLQFLVDTLREQLRLLETEAKRFAGIQNELNNANLKLKSVKLIQDVLDSTTKEAEEIIDRETNAKTLAVLVATLKRELVSSESRRKELSCYLENVQDECKKKEDMVRMWKKQAEILKNSNGHLKKEIESLNGTLMENDSSLSNPKVEPDQVPQPKVSKRISIIRQTTVDSPPVHEKVRLIEESTSPYLHIKSSSVGLAPLLLREPSREQDDKPKNSNLQIFNRPRLFAESGIPRRAHLGIASNGLGISERRNSLNLNIDALPKIKKIKRSFQNN